MVTGTRLIVMLYLSLTTGLSLATGVIHIDNTQQQRVLCILFGIIKQI